MLSWPRIRTVGAFCAALASIPIPVRAQDTRPCRPSDLANGACIDILTRVPSAEVGWQPALFIGADEYLIADVATGGAFPAAVSGPVSLPRLPAATFIGPDVYVAKFRTNDAVARWVVPITASSLHKLLRGPQGRVYVVATTRSPSWPLPPSSAADLLPDWRGVVGIISPDGVLERVLAPSYDGWSRATVVGVDAAGNLLTLDDAVVNRRNPDTFDVVEGAMGLGVMFPGQDEGRDEIVSLEWPTTAGTVLHAWRRDDFSNVSTVMVPGARLVTDVARVGPSDLYVTGVLFPSDLTDTMPCPMGDATPKATDTGVFLAKVTLGSQAIDWIRCVGRWRSSGLYAEPSFLRDGRLLVTASSDALGAETSEYDSVVYRSVDGGETWAAANGVGSGDVEAVVLDPTTPAVVYATTRGGVSKSTDGGATWRDVSPAGWASFGRVSVNPLLTSELFVVGGNGTPWALLRSADAGATWNVMSGGQYDPASAPPLPTCFDATRPDLVWSQGAGQVSADRGRTWTLWNGLTPWSTPTGGWLLAGTPLGRRYGMGTPSNILWAAGEMPWARATGESRFATSIVVDPHRHERAFAALDTARILATRNGGPSWFDVPVPLTRPPSSAPSIAASSRPGDVETSLLLWTFETIQRQGTRRRLWRSDNSGQSWAALTPCAGCVSYVRAAADPDIVFGYGRQSGHRTYTWWSVGGDHVEQRMHIPADGESFLRRYPGLAGAASDYSPDTDVDGDGLPNGWERQFGADAADAGADPDGDGLSNAQEMEAGSHPVGRHTYVCAEAGTSPALATRLDVFNPDAAVAARVLVRYGLDVDPDNRALLVVPAGATRAVDLSDGQLRFAGGEHPLIVESDLPLGVTRTMTWGAWGATRVGQHAGTCVTPRARWQFAEGSTRAPFQVFYILMNPSATPMTVRATYLRNAPLAPVEREYDVPAGARTVVWLNADVPELGRGDVAAAFESADATPFSAERSMYMEMSGDPFFGGGTNGSGLEPATEWWLAEGVTGGAFATYVLLANATMTDAVVNVSYATTTGDVIDVAHVVPARSRRSIAVADEAPSLASTSFATHVVVTNGVAVTAERATWWSADARVPWWQSPASEGHVGGASPVTASAWTVAGGASTTGLPSSPDADTYLLVGKFSDAFTAAIVTLHFTDGSVLSAPLTLASGRRRVTVPLQDLFGREVIDGRAFAVTLVAADSSARLVVELSQYRSSTTWWSAGTSVAGTALPR